MHAATDYYALLGLPWCFALDPEQLDAAYRERARHTHPDRHVRHGAAAQAEALAAATALNEAYRILKDPALRATHLLALHGVESRAAPLAAGFLMQQMAWHERLAEARQAGDGNALQCLDAELRAQLRDREARLAPALADTAYAAASTHLAEFRFLRRLLDAVADAEVGV